LEAPNPDTSYSEFQDLFSFPESLLATASTPPPADNHPQRVADFLHAGGRVDVSANQTTVYVEMKSNEETEFEKGGVLILNGHQVQNNQHRGGQKYCLNYILSFFAFVSDQDPDLCK